MSRLSSRPFDPTASTLLNLIVGETHSLVRSDDYIFVPSHGPFYTDSVVVRSKGLVLKLHKDYEFKALHANATQATGKSVACIIQITNKNLFEASVDYQVVGGQYSEVFSVLKYMVDNFGEGVMDKIRWENIGDKPTQFNAAAHRHPYWEFTGWDVLLSAMDKILQGVHYRKSKLMREVYDYYYAKEQAFLQQFNHKNQLVLATIAQLQLNNTDPLKIVRIVAGNNPPNESIDGVWRDTTTIGNDRVLGGTSKLGDIGKTVPISEAIVYPQPDNILLDEQENPILRDDDEWIYLDNQYPTIPMAGGIVDDDGVEFTGQEWDLFLYRGYYKIANAGALVAVLSSDRSTMADGETVIFKLETNRYPIGLKIPYQLLGVGPDNVNVPINGFMTIAAGGVAFFTVKLIAGSPATFKDTMVLELAIQGGTSHSVKYQLSTNATKKVKIGFTENLNDIRKSLALPYEKFYMKVDRSGFMATDSKFVDITFSFDDGATHPILLDYNQTIIPGQPILLELDQVTDWFALEIQPTATYNSRKLNVNMTYRSQPLATGNIDTTAVTATVKAVSIETGKYTDTIRDDEPFRFVALTNATTLLVPTVIENTVGSDLTPEITGVVTAANGHAQTTQLVVGRTHRRKVDYVTVRFSTLQGLALGEHRITIPAEL